MLVKNPQYPTPAAMCIPKVFSFVLICMMLSGGATAATPDSVVIDVQEGRVALSWGGAARLVGGVPHFEGADVSLQPVQGAGDTFTFPTSQGEIGLQLRRGEVSSFVSLYAARNGQHCWRGEDYVGFFFDAMPGFRQGVAIWRYKPWNA